MISLRNPESIIYLPSRTLNSVCNSLKDPKISQIIPNKKTLNPSYDALKEPQIPDVIPLQKASRSPAEFLRLEAGHRTFGFGFAFSV